MDTIDTPELQNTSRTGLIVMAVLSFIGGAGKLALAIFISYEILSRQDIYSIGKEETVALWTAFAVIVHVTVLFLGTIMMLYRKKSGLYVYLGSQVLAFVVFTWFWIGITRGRLHREEIAAILIIYFGILLFSLLYILFRKQIGRNRRESLQE